MERKRSGLPVLCMLLTVLIVSLSVFTVAGDDNIVFDDYVSNSQNSASGTDSEDDNADDADGSAENEGSDTSAGYTGSGNSSAKSEYEENNDGDDTYISNNGTVFKIPRPEDKTARVYDYAGLFTDAQKEALTEKIRSIEESKKADIVILTSKDVPKDAYDSMETTMRYARQFLVDNGFKENSFVCLLDMNNRVFWVCGYGEYGDVKYSDFGQDTANKAQNSLVDGDYYKSMMIYLDEVNRLGNMMMAAIPTPLSLLISAVLAVVAVLIMNSMHNTTQPSKKNAPLPEVLNYESRHHDKKFLGTTVHRRHIERNNGSRGGGGGGGFSGGGFSSGSGGSHSGGGVHF